MWQTNLHRIIPNLTWFIAYACGLFSFSYYNLQQRKLLSFFKHWENFEINFSNKSDTGASSALVKQKRLAKFMYVSYFVITCGCLLGFCNSLRSSNASFMLSHYQILRDTLTIPFVVTIHLIAISLVWVSFSLLDIVPAIIFYCASKQIQSIEQELKNDFGFGLLNVCENVALLSTKQFKTEFCIRLRNTWFKYETLFNLIEEANRTFGILMFINHGIKFSLTCTLTSMALSTTKDAEVDKLAVLTTAITFVFRFLTGLLPTAQLHSSSSNLRATASSLMSQHCYKMSKEERSFAFLFIHRLQDHQLAACPLNLYYVTYSILLNVFTLTVSYVIILVQLK